jgi:dCMP deaminase
MAKITWDETFMALAKVYAARSKDESSKIGCVIVGPYREQRAGGYNGIVRDVKDDVPERHVRPAKYLWFEHAERNAIFNAARIGISTDGCVIYVCGLPPCANCARAIVQSGIVEVIVESFDVPERWKEDMDVSKLMLSEAGVVVRNLNGDSWY